MASVAEYTELCDRIVQHMVDNSKLTIFIAGNVGSGKSALVNSLLGWEAATVGSSLEPVTKEVKDFDGLVKVQGPIGNITATVWDSPGLQDPDVDKESLLKNMAVECNDVDLVVYCIQMTRTKLDVGEVNSICDITNALGTSVWEKAFFVLTFANKLELPIEYDKTYDLQKYYYQRKAEWSQLLHKRLINNAEVKADIANKVPIVTAGYGKDPLPHSDKIDWYQEFWTTCCERVTFDAFSAFLTASIQLEEHAKRYITEFLSEKFKRKIAHRASTDVFLGYVKTCVNDLDTDYFKYSDMGDIWLQVIDNLQKRLERRLQKEEENKSLLVT